MSRVESFFLFPNTLFCFMSYILRSSKYPKIYSRYVGQVKSTGGPVSCSTCLRFADFLWGQLLLFIYRDSTCFLLQLFTFWVLCISVLYGYLKLYIEDIWEQIWVENSWTYQGPKKTGWIFLKFDSWIFFENLSRNLNFIKITEEWRVLYMKRCKHLW